MLRVGVLGRERAEVSRPGPLVIAPPVTLAVVASALLQRVCDVLPPDKAALLRLGQTFPLAIGWRFLAKYSDGPRGSGRLHVCVRAVGKRDGCSAYLGFLPGFDKSGQDATTITQAAMEYGWAVDPGAYAAESACSSCRRRDPTTPYMARCWWHHRTLKRRVALLQRPRGVGGPTWSW